MINQCGPRQKWTNRWVTLLLIWFTGICSFAHGEEKVFRTGIESDGAALAASPDGQFVLFTTGRPTRELRLLDVASGEIRVIPGDFGRIHSFPVWSRDGLRVAAVSTVVRKGHYVLDDVQIVVFEPHTWMRRVITSGEGVRLHPFFSRDGKTVYYFKGKKRESGKTVGKDYDLFAVDLESGRETQLTHTKTFTMGPGDDDGKTILFETYDSKNLTSFIPMGNRINSTPQAALFLYDKSTGVITSFPIDQRSGIFNFYSPLRDQSRNVYFITNKSRPRENYRFFLYRTNPRGQNPEELAELSVSARFDIASDTGDIFVTEWQKQEPIRPEWFRRFLKVFAPQVRDDAKLLTIRRLAVKADH